MVVSGVYEHMYRLRLDQSSKRLFHGPWRRRLLTTGELSIHRPSTLCSIGAAADLLGSLRPKVQRSQSATDIHRHFPSRRQRRCDSSTSRTGTAATRSTTNMRRGSSASPNRRPRLVHLDRSITGTPLAENMTLEEPSLAAFLRDNGCTRLNLDRRHAGAAKGLRGG